MKIPDCHGISFWRLRQFKYLLPMLLLCFMISTSRVNMTQAEIARTTKVYGNVIDFETHLPIPGAQIAVINDTMRPWQLIDLRNLMAQQRIIAQTNESGIFEAYVESYGGYTFYVYCDDVSTPGIDYVPVSKEVSVQDFPCYLSFSVLPGASINAFEDPFFSFDDSLFSCNVIDEEGLLELTGSFRQWWEGRSGIENRTIVVPANMGVKIEIVVYKVLEGGFRYQNIEWTANFSIPIEGGYFNLSQGELVAINLRNARLDVESSIMMPRYIDYARLVAEEIGVLSSYERVRISSAEELLWKAQSSISGGDYVGAQADLYESHLILEDVGKAFFSLFQNSVLSIYFITPFMAVTSSALGAIFSKDKRKRIVTSIVFYGFLIILLYFAYPGYKFIQNPFYNPLKGTFLESFVIPLLSIASIGLGIFLINGPYTYGEKTNRRSLSIRSAILAAFSLAADNLKRRKLRTFLTTVFMLVSVFAFIFTTSYSYEGGFVVDQEPGEAPSEGMFVCQQASDPRIYPFGPVDSVITQWLSKRPEVLLTVPLLKNVPQIGTPPPPIGMLFGTDPSLNYSVSGVLGVSPTLETNITKIDQIIAQEEGAGRFLCDSDFNGILISKEAKEALHMDVNDTVRFHDQDFVVIGVFDGRELGGIKDLNGDPMIPQEIRVLETMGGPVYLSSYVAPENVVIMLSETASALRLNIVVSRVIVQTRMKEDIDSLARELVLIFPRIETYTSVNNEIKHLYVGNYQVIRGFSESTILLALMVLNVGIMMLNVVYERRREVVVMSTVGLNPSHVTAIFACEALIMAFIAGSLGYVLGMTSCIFLYFLPSPPILRYKVEAFWGILALCFSISASVLGSIIPASKASIMATPSLLRRFIVTSREKAREGAWTLDIPVKIKERDIREFLDFVEERLEVYNDPIRYEERVDNIIRQKEIYGPAQERIYFIYKYSGNKIITENELYSIRDATSEEYSIKLASKSLLPWTIIGREASARQTASFVRRLTLEYTERERI